MEQESKRELARKILSSTPVVKTQEFTRAGVPRMTIRRMVASGEITEVGRGFYAAADSEPTSNRSLIEAMLQAPGGVVCLLSALRYHEIGTQNPHEVWIALRRGSWIPKIEGIRSRVVLFSGSAFSEGIETVDIEGIEIKVYSPAKTVADLFKYRNKIGIDVAVEALKDALRGRKATVEELVKYSEICRVKSIMRPYLESLA